MSDFIIGVAELNEMIPIFAKYNFNSQIQKIESANGWIDKDGNKILEYDIDGLYIFSNKYLLEYDNILKDLYEHTKDKSFNIAHFLEFRIHDSYDPDSAFNGYVRLIKNTNYAINNSENIYKAIEKQEPSTNKIFWNMVTLATYIQDNETCTKAFKLILDNKRAAMYSFGLLDLEKIKRTWDKKIKGVDVQTLPNKEYQFINQSFNEITAAKTKSFCTTTSGQYLNVFVDVNLICQENKLSKNKNNALLTGVFYELASYVSKNPNDSLSLNKVSITDEDDITFSFNVVFYYNCSSQTELIKSFVGNLIDYSITKEKNGKLQGESITQQGADKFFSSFIMNHTLENTLDKKEETKVKKNKL